ncbi:adenine deaminase [candidate division WOR-3 bacterium JGI_Cruoil_03_44_89]|mgnify:CR=1 FL=1|uniref:Adenine deaminase n=1 Tax=candidate division WOR-3 bacterium JGI_Cruoil_03_44_89 TaxID=1973748 RepID=A0A235BUZ8_UNCW3|nr:MAG: adenine deaminase [candidate division WOR-3 bacterium JGI_Cruoil_03_44_89]
MNIKDIIPVALGEEPADVLIKNARIVNVFSGTIEKNNIALFRKRIAGVGDYKRGKRVMDLKGMYVVPGLIDAHLHIESSMLSPREFAKVVLLRGTTTVIADPHEIANVIGLDGVEYMIRATEGIPLNVYVTLPSAVPATNLETSGARLGVEDMIGFLEKHPRILALGEVMNYPGVLNRDTELIAKIELLRHRYKKIDGHAPSLTGKKLNAYITAFIRSDHESTEKNEALEKVKRGMQVFIREGSAAKNFNTLIDAVNSRNFPYFSFCTDDRNPVDIMNEGHIDFMVRSAVKKGITPVNAIRMATINTARYFNLRSMGAIAPGYKADMLVINNLKDFHIHSVIKDSKVVVEEGKLRVRIEGIFPEAKGRLGPMNPKRIEEKDIVIKDTGKKIRVMEVFYDTLITKELITEPTVKGGLVVADPDRDIMKLVVIDRYRGENFTVGFIKGLGIKRGAIGTSVGHDSHNIAIAGGNDSDIVFALGEVRKMGGGLVVVNNGKLLSRLPLPIAGLMSDKPLEEVVSAVNEINRSSMLLGIERDPFMTLSFVQLPVIPAIRITDRGIVDVNKQGFVSLYV